MSRKPRLQDLQALPKPLVGALATYGYGMRSAAENKPRVKAEA
ncbi:hypothetical protein [Desemzia sp. FAM 23989]